MIWNQWYAILPSQKVKKNQVTGVTRLNLPLALFRNSRGQLGCVQDQCSHRGAALSKGKMKGDCLQCPFHGLAFDRFGRCQRIPAYGKASLDDLSRFNVKHHPVKEKNGIIYLWYGDEAEMIDTLPFFDADLDATDTYYESEDHWQAHYSRCIENQLDVVHLPFVHRTTIGRGNKTLVNGPKVLFEEGTLITSADNEKDRGQKPKSPGESKIKSTYLSFKFPNIWMNHIHEKIKVLIYFAPVDDHNTILYIRFYCKMSDKKILNRMIATIGNVANLVVEKQDKRIVVTQKPKASSYYSQENLLMGDGPIIQYRKLREQMKNPQPTRESDAL